LKRWSPKKAPASVPESVSGKFIMKDRSVSLILYICKRLFFAFFIVLGVITIVFFVSRIVPGDPTLALTGPEATEENIAHLRRVYGLDRPLPIQYLVYIEQLLLHQNLGKSILTHRPVIEDLRRYFMATLELVTVAMLLAVAVAIPLGVLSAVWKDRWIDQISRVFALSGISMPIFWFGLLLQLFFSNRLNLLPLHERIGLDVVLTQPLKTITGLFTVDSLLTANWGAFMSVLSHLILPAITLAYPSIAQIARMTRSMMLEVLSQEYILSAEANGLPKWRVLLRHALPNAFIPTLTVIGMSYSYLLGGTVLVETVFDWPGMGLYAVSSIFNLDFPAIVGVTLLFGIVRVIVNLIVDILYFALDPRIQE